MAKYKTNSYTRATDDVVWLWAADDLFTLRPAVADWEWMLENGEHFFRVFYAPWFDPSDGLYRGQPLFHDITNSAYPAGMTRADCVLLKALSTNCLYYRGCWPLSRWIGPDPITVEGIVHRPPKRSGEGTQYLIRSDHVFLAGRSFPAEGRLLLFLKKKDVPLRLGDRLRLLCRVHSPKGFHNPGVFSYERHLSFERIDAIGFLSGDGNWVKIGEGFGHPLLLRIEDWRDAIRRFLGRETDPRSSGILKALVLGEQGDIPEEVKEHFIVTGIPLIFSPFQAITSGSWRSSLTLSSSGS